MKKLLNKILNKVFNYDDYKTARAALPYAENVVMTSRQITPLALKFQVEMQSRIVINDKAMELMIKMLADRVATYYQRRITINNVLITVG